MYSVANKVIYIVIHERITLFLGIEQCSILATEIYRSTIPLSMIIIRIITHYFKQTTFVCNYCSGESHQGWRAGDSFQQSQGTGFTDRQHVCNHRTRWNKEYANYLSCSLSRSLHQFKLIKLSIYCRASLIRPVSTPATVALILLCQAN